MPTLLMALSLGAVSMIIVFISGIMSGVVRYGILSLRAVFAFCMTSAASYFLMMLFDLYDDAKLKALRKAEEEARAQAEAEAAAQAPPDSEELESDTAVESPAVEVSAPESPPPPATGFQPMDASTLPNVGK